MKTESDDISKVEGNPWKLTNEELSKDPLYVADERMPQAWYEVDPRIFIGGFLLFSFCVDYLYVMYARSQPLVVHAVSAALYITSEILDRQSTLQCFHARDRAQEAGVEVGDFRETNITASHLQTAESFERSRLVMCIDMVGTAFAAINPGVGLPFALGKSMAALNNIRQAERLNLAAEIARSSTFSE